MMTEDVEVSESTSGSAPTDETNYRLIGLAVFGGGLLLLLCFVGWPVYQAHSGANEFTIFKKMIGIGVFGVVTGINAIIFGKSAFTWFPAGDTNVSDIKFTTWLLIAVNGGIIVYAFMLLEEYLSKLGYDVQRL